MVVFDIILPIVYALVGAALIWLLVELVITIKKVRTKALDTIDELQPTIDNVQKMVNDIQPTVKKVDPLVDRVTLTVDTVNLEMMRVDEILEDVSQITGSLTKTVNVVDNVTSAPVDLVNSVTKRVRSKFRPKYASDESIAAGLGQPSDQPATNPIVDFADAAVDVAGGAFRDQQAKSAERKAVQQEREAASEAKSEKMSATSERLASEILDNVVEDSN